MILRNEDEIIVTSPKIIVFFRRKLDGNIYYKSFDNTITPVEFSEDIYRIESIEGFFTFTHYDNQTGEILTELKRTQQELFFSLDSEKHVMNGFAGGGGGSQGRPGRNGTSGFSGFSGFSGLNGQAAASGFSGYSGISGFSGFSGESGTSGYSGFSGFSGDSGVSGYSGFSGESGFSGYSGISGFSGFSGESGTSGFSGQSGFSGYSGISGYSGFSGFSGFSGISGFSGYSGFSGTSGFSGFSGTSGYSGFSGFSGASVANAWLLNGNTVVSEKWIGTIDNFAFPIRTNNTEKARFLSTGEFIVGDTTSFNAIYTIQQKISAGSLGHLIACYSTTDANVPALAFLKSNSNTIGTGAATASGESLGAINITGYNSSNTAATPISIDFFQDGAGGATFIPGRIEFNIGTNAAARTQRMIILNTGEVLIGETTPFAGEFVGARKDQNAHTNLLVINNTSGTAAQASIAATSPTTSVYLRATSALFTPSGILTADSAILSTQAVAGMNIGTTSNAQLSFWTNNTKRMSIAAAGAVDISNGTTSASVPALKLTSTLEQTAIAVGVQFNVTSAGSAAFQQVSHQSQLLAGYTGSAGTRAGRFDNAAAGTGTDPWVTGNANVGILGTCSATTTGTNMSVVGFANGGNLSIGVAGAAVTNKNSATNIGVLGFGLNGGTTPIQIGGYFGLHSNNPTYISAALICDNGTQTSDIFVARDNGTIKFKITDSGNTVTSNAALATTATDGFLYIPTCAGAPTGVPTAQTGTVAIIYDTTNNKIMVYNGAWRGIVLV